MTTPLRLPRLRTALACLGLLLLLPLAAAPNAAHEGHAHAHAAENNDASAIAAVAARVRLESMRKHDEYGGAFIELDGEVLVDFFSCVGWRWFVTTLDADGELMRTESHQVLHFHTEDEVKKGLLAHLDEVPEGGYVLIAVHDTLTPLRGYDTRDRVDNDIQAALEEFGIATDLRAQTNATAYLAIGRRGAAPGTALEQVGQGELYPWENPEVFEPRDALRHPAIPDSADGDAEGTVRVLVTDEATGEPLPEALVSWQQGRQARQARTDRQGRVRFAVNGWSRIYLGLTVRHRGHATMRVDWSDSEPGEGPEAREVRIAMPAGHRMSGRILDVDGSPAAGQRIALRVPGYGHRGDGEPRPRVNDQSPWFADDAGHFAIQAVPAHPVNATLSYGVGLRPAARVELTPERLTLLRSGFAVFSLPDPALKPRD